jgi:hypothetical protein
MIQNSQSDMSASVSKRTFNKLNKDQAKSSEKLSKSTPTKSEKKPSKIQKDLNNFVSENKSEKNSNKIVPP